MENEMRLKPMMEQILKENSELYAPTKEGAELVIQKLKSELASEVPHFSASRGNLGSDGIYMLIAFDPKEKWSNGYLENSNYVRMVLYSNGTMEVFSQQLTNNKGEVSPLFKGADVTNRNHTYPTRLPIKFRKTKAKNLDDAILKIKKFIHSVKQMWE